MSVKSQHLLSNVPQPDVVESAADDEKESENFVGKKKRKTFSLHI